MPFIHKMLLAGHEVVLYGKVKDSNGRLVIDHPEVEILRGDEDRESIHLERIVPIYRNVAGIAQRRLREIMHLLLLQTVPESLEIATAVAGGAPRHQALREAHFPGSMDEAGAARRRCRCSPFSGPSGRSSPSSGSPPPAAG